MKHPIETKLKSEKMYDALMKHGYVISAQRRILIEALCEQQSIYDIEAFWIKLRIKHGISWATVYTNIRLLANIGLVKKDGHEQVRVV